MFSRKHGRLKRKDHAQDGEMLIAIEISIRPARRSGIARRRRWLRLAVGSLAERVAPGANLSRPVWRLAMQSSGGGWTTDYKEAKPVGLANVETTCLSLLALQILRK